MSGFFKKLFNRVLGKKEEAAIEASAGEALPEPEPAPEAEHPSEPEPAPPAEEAFEPDRLTEKPEIHTPAPESASIIEEASSLPSSPAKLKVKKAVPPRKAEQPKPDAKKPEKKKAAAKEKIETGKIETKKSQSKPKQHSEPKKAEAQAHKPAAKKTPPKKPLAPEPKPTTPDIAERHKGHTPQPEDLSPPEVHEPVASPPIQKKPESPSLPAPSTPTLPIPSKTSRQIEQAKEPEPEQPKPSGWFSRLKHGLSKSSKSITTSITSIFTKRKLDASTLEELEDVLIQADLGLPMTERIIKAVSTGRYDKEIDPEEVKTILASEIAKVLKPVEVPFNFGAEKPFVILVVGVNGSGKTTTIGKLGAIAAREGFEVMFAACDTFRAAAIEQLGIWGQRIGARTMSRPTGADASGLAFDALKAARENHTDILFIDTAGRLQNKAHLMDELDKIVRVLKKQDPAAPHAVLLVLDATTGQNAMLQAEVFTKVAGVTGLIMTKLDGTARGGILVAIAEKFGLPVHAIGVGEQIDDLQPFDAYAFSRAIAGLEDA